MITAALRRFGVPDMRGRRLLAGAVMLDTVGVGLFTPLSLLYFTFTTNVPVSQVGVTISAASLLALPTGLLLAGLVDRWGPRLFMSGTNIVYAAGFTIYLFADSPVTIFAGAFLAAISDRIYWSAWPPYITDMAGRDQFQSWFAFLESIKSAAFAIAALLVALSLAHPTAQVVRMLVAVNILTSLMAAVVLAITPMRQTGLSTAVDRDENRPPASWSATIRRPQYWLLLIGQSLISPTWQLFTIAFPIFFVRVWGLPAWYPAVLYGLSCCYVFVAQTPATHALRNLRREAVIAIAGSCVVLAMALLIILHYVSRDSAVILMLSGIAVGALVSSAFLLYQPAAYAVAMSASQNDGKGRMAATFDFGSAVTNSATPALVGLLILGHSNWLWVAIAAAAIASTLSFGLQARTKASLERVTESAQPTA